MILCVFTKDFDVQQYFAQLDTAFYYTPPFVTYSLLGDSITFTMHYSYPSEGSIDETFNYILNGNSLTIKGFSNPFALTAEGKGDVHFTKVE